MLFAKTLLKIERSKPLGITKAWICNLKGGLAAPWEWSSD
jgi:hypothetical protein